MPLFRVEFPAKFITTQQETPEEAQEAIIILLTAHVRQNTEEVEQSDPNEVKVEKNRLRASDDDDYIGNLRNTY